MFKKYFYLSALLVLLPAHSTFANLLDKGYVADYLIAKNGINLGITKRTLAKTSAGLLEFKSRTAPRGVLAMFFSDKVTEISQLRRNDNQFVPVLYSFAQSGGKKDQYWQLKFNWQEKQLLSTFNNRKHPLKPGTQELLGFQLQLMLDLQAGKRTMTYAIADRRGIETYTIKQTGQQRIDTDAGEFDTIKLESSKTRKGRKFTFWCAPKMDFLPIKVLRTKKDDDKIELVLNKLHR